MLLCSSVYDNKPIVCKVKPFLLLLKYIKEPVLSYFYFSKGVESVLLPLPTYTN